MQADFGGVRVRFFKFIVCTSTGLTADVLKSVCLQQICTFLLRSPVSVSNVCVLSDQRIPLGCTLRKSAATVLDGWAREKYDIA